MSVAVLQLALPQRSLAQGVAGVVTNVNGPVTVNRAALREPAPLRFRDRVFVQDRIATGPDAVARILLGGHAIVTVREHSTVTITESPSVSTIAVGQGRIAVAVARERMRPGDVAEVRTPNAVAGIRGTVIVAEVRDASYSAISVLKGVIDVRRLESGQTVGAAMILNRLERVVIRSGNHVLPPAEAMSIEAGRRLADDFRLVPARVAPAAAIVEAEIQRAVESMTAAEAATEPRQAPVVANSATEGVNVSNATADLAAVPPVSGTASMTLTTVASSSNTSISAPLTASTATIAPANPVFVPTTTTATTAPTVSGAAVPKALTTGSVAVLSTPKAISGTITSPTLGGAGVSGAAVSSMGAISTSPSAKSQSVLESVVERAIGRDALKADRSGSNRGRH